MDKELLQILQSIDRSLKVIATKYGEVQEDVSTNKEVADIIPEPARKRAPKGNYRRRGLYPHDIIMDNAGLKVSIPRFRAACANLGIHPEKAISGSCRWYIPKKAIPMVVKELRENLI